MHTISKKINVFLIRLKSVTLPKHFHLVPPPPLVDLRWMIYIPATGLGLLPLSQRAAVDAYVKETEVVAAQLRAFAYRAQGPGLAGHVDIATAAESQSWTLKELRVRTARCIALRQGCLWRTCA